MTSSKIIKCLKSNGWELVRVRGDHYIFKNKHSKLNISVPHPRKDTPLGLIKSIEKKTGLKF